MKERQQQLRSEINRITEDIRNEQAFPAHVADAINILCHEKIGRLEGWSSEEKDDLRAQAIAGGARDREKQDALYVRLDKIGRAISIPPRTIDDEARTQALEHAKNLQTGLSYMLDSHVQPPELNDLIKALKVMFAGPEELAKIFPNIENPFPQAVGRRRST